ncbi:kinesin heavy chain-like [Pseudochaenichthys georgianus]|uniref:kinesin heavy chain-like n=1 Tax=Pseudochaenichthys georgianus TaxID=52239 RepID=UPI00146F4CB0|nr:ninein-like protein [Pseudochaenichthys georgianus]
MADRTPVRHSHSVISFQSFYGERLLQQSSQPFFGSWHAPMFASAHTDVVQGHNNGEHLAMSPKSLLQPLDLVLLYAQEKLKKQSLEEVALREEMAKMALKQVSTSKALEDLMGLQTQARLEKMEANINEMEEDLKKEKTRWSDLSCQRLEEISSLGTELSVFQSHNQYLKEENTRVTLKQVSTSEALEELMGFQTQANEEKEAMEAKINEMEEDFKKEKTTWSDLSCQWLEEISSLGTELLDAQSHIDHLKEENAKLTMKDDSTSEALKELMGLHTLAKMEKEEMVSKLNQMEEDFNKEKTTWSDLSSQRLEEISSLGTELSDAKSHIDHLNEENAKLTMKDDSTSEAFKELMGLQTLAKTEMEANVNQMEEDFNKEKKSLRTELSDAQSHIDHLKEENAKLTIKDDSTLKPSRS